MVNTRGRTITVTGKSYVDRRQLLELNLIAFAHYLHNQWDAGLGDIVVTSP